MARDFDIEQVAQAIEADIGEALHDIRQALAEVKAGRAAAQITTPEQSLLRQTGGWSPRCALAWSGRATACAQPRSAASVSGWPDATRQPS